MVVTLSTCLEISELAANLLSEKNLCYSRWHAVKSYFLSGLCSPHYIRLWGKFRRGICGQAWTWETQLRYSALFSYLKSREKDFRTGITTYILYNGCIQYIMVLLYTTYKCIVMYTSTTLSYLQPTLDIFSILEQETPTTSRKEIV